MASKSVLPSLAPVPVFSTSKKPINSTLLFRSYDLQLKCGSVTVYARSKKCTVMVDECQ